MNKHTAESKGCDFTGGYSWDKDEVQKRLYEYRKKYPDCKFYLVSEPPNPLSRGHHGTGYSVYACKKYNAYKSLEYVDSFMAGYAAQVDNLQREFMAKVNKLEGQRIEQEEHRIELLKIINS